MNGLPKTALGMLLVVLVVMVLSASCSSPTEVVLVVVLLPLVEADTRVVIDARIIVSRTIIATRWMLHSRGNFSIAIIQHPHFAYIQIEKQRIKEFYHKTKVS